MGKKQIGELQPSELVTTIIISNIATISLEDPNLPMMTGVVPILLIVSLDIILSIITMKKDRIRRIFTGTPRVIVENGIIDQSEMRNLRYTLDDLFETMRDKGYFDIRDVGFAVVETTGKINFQRKTEGGAPAAVIKDGNIDKDEVARANMDEKDIRKILFNEGVSLDNVYLLEAETAESYYLIKKT